MLPIRPIPFSSVRFEVKVRHQPYAVPSDTEVKQLLGLGDPVIGRVMSVCLLSGMRAGEAAGLLREDLVAKGNLGDFFYVRPNQLRSLKTDAAERQVPVHSSLGPVLAQLPSAGPLFPDLKVNDITKRFAKIRVALGVDRPGLVFHSTRKWFVTQCERTGVPEQLTAIFADMDRDLMLLLNRQIKELEGRIERAVVTDAELAATAAILRSVPGIGPVASTMLIAEMPELGQITGEQAAALTGLAPIAHDSGTLRGKRAIGGGRRMLRHVMFQAALVASHHNPVLKVFADRLRAAGKPHKVIITAVARKLVTVANALYKSRQKWTAQPG